MTEIRQAPVRSSIQAAVEGFYCDVAERLESNDEVIQPEDMEELLLQLTVQHFLMEMDSPGDAPFVEKRLAHFKQRLDRTVQKELDRQRRAVHSGKTPPF